MDGVLMALNLTGYHYSIDVVSTAREYVRYMPLEITFKVSTSNNEYVQGDMLTIWYKNRMEEIDLTEYEYYEDITINLLEFREWTGQGEPLGLILSYDDEVQDEVWIEINERMPTIQESIDFVAERLSDILNEKGIDVSSSTQTKYQRLSPYIELVSGNQLSRIVLSTRISCIFAQGGILSFDIGRIYGLKDSNEQDVKLNLNVSTLYVSDDKTGWTSMSGGMNLVIKKMNGVITASCYNSQDTLVFSTSKRILYVKLTSNGYIQLFITVLNGIVDKSVDGLTTLINKVRLLDVYSAPPLDGTDKVTSLIQDYPFTTGDGVGGGYHQCGYLSDGFRNDCDWEISMDLRKSQWDGGFLLLLNPYTESDLDCSTTNKWDCIFHNGQEDTLQWIDGYIKTNKGTDLTNTGLTYIRNTTNPIKLIKKSNVLLYYENGVYRGKYVWNNLLNAPRVYVGIMTWGGSGSVNTFSNLLYRPMKSLDEYLTNVSNYSYAQGSNSLSPSSDSSPPLLPLNILSVLPTAIALNNEEFIKENYYQLHFDWRVTNGYDGGFGMGTTDDYWMFSQQYSQAVVQHGKLDNDSGGLTSIYDTDLTSDDGNWVKTGGNANIEYGSNGLKVTGTNTTDTYYLIDETKINIPHSNIVVEFDITASAEGTYNDSTQFCVCNTLIHTRNGQLTVTDSDNIVYAQETLPIKPIAVKMECGNTNTLVYVNGSLFATVPNGDWIGVGMRTYNNRSMSITNLKISTVGVAYQVIQSSQRFSSYVPVIITRKGNNWTIDINNKALFFSFEADQPNCFGLRKWSSGSCMIRDLWVTDVVPKDTDLSVDLTEHQGSVWVDGTLVDEFDNPLANKKIIIEVNGSVTETITTDSNGSFETEEYDSSVRQSFVCSYEGDVLYTASSENIIWEI